MNKPNKLYKYQSFNTFTLENLANQQLFLSHPDNFNDPFDCRMPIHYVPSDSDCSRYFEGLINKNKDMERELKQLYITDGKLNETFKTHFQEKFAESLKGTGSNHGVACFSDKNDDILMWAYYADGHKGLCLEFGTKNLPFSKAVKVDYELTLPEIQWIEILLNHSFGEYLKLVKTKYSDWEHESEWRVMHAKPNITFKYTADDLLGTYFGSEMPESHIKTIKSILQKQNNAIRFYKMVKDPKKFAIASKEING